MMLLTHTGAFAPPDTPAPRWRVPWRQTPSAPTVTIGEWRASRSTRTAGAIHPNPAGPRTGAQGLVR